MEIRRVWITRSSDELDPLRYRSAEWTGSTRASQPCQFRSISIWRGPAVFPDSAQMAAHRALEKPPPGPPTRLPFGPFPRQRSGGLLEVRFYPSWLDRRIQPERVCLSDRRTAMQISQMESGEFRIRISHPLFPAAASPRQASLGSRFLAAIFLAAPPACCSIAVNMLVFFLFFFF